MGFLQDMSDTLNQASWILNEAAFGDIRNVFGSNEYMHNFYLRKIGVYNRNYDFMVKHIMRNIGNAEHTYDGYGTPIGELSNPFYNTETRVPWFFADDYKNSTSNYIEYAKATYGAAISVENINETSLFHLIDSGVKVGYIDGLDAINALQNNYNFIPNPNMTGTDTHLGLVGGYYNQETLSNAITSNDERLKYQFGITSAVRGAFGLTTKNITGQEGNRSFDKKVSDETGRFESTNTLKSAFSPLLSIDSPIETSNYGNIKGIGSYEGFYNYLTDRTKSYYADNVFFNRERNSKNKKFYYPSFPGVSENRVYNGENINIDKLTARYIVKTSNANITDLLNGGVYVYTESENGTATNVTFASFNSGAKFGRYTSYAPGLKTDDLISKTNEAFKQGKYKTIIARFHTDASEADSTDTTQTAVSNIWGISHGRNLLKSKAKWNDESEGYTNPYCRVWTFHHQYHRLADAIRPFDYSADELYSSFNFSAFTSDNSEYGFENGRARLERFGTLNKNNGLVNITPIDSGDENRRVDIKNCMFSIENLAWKDAFSTDYASRSSFQAGGLSPEQKGPFGGRIMWFPPYDLKFNEDVNVNWNETNFIGRGEGIYTYTNTTRTGNLSFKLLVDHPSIIDYWENKGKSSSNSVDDIDDPEQQILRFFAGCDMLKAAPGPEPEEDPAIYDRPVPSPDSQEITFFVFFPNNYSGKDDGADYAMKYLSNGLGAGKEREWHLLPDGTCIEGEDDGDSIKDYKIQYATNKLYSSRTEWKTVGGYEMRPGIPVSLNATQNDDGFIASVKVGDYGNGVGCNDGETSLAAWWGTDHYWYYRIDKKYLKEKLLEENYIDSTSFGLNSKFGHDKVAEHYGITDNTLFSFADVYVALSTNKSWENGPYYVLRDDNGDTLFDKERVNTFKKWIDQYGVKGVVCEGMASAPGRNSNNYDLQLDRARTVKEWLASAGNIDGNIIKPTSAGAGGAGVGINNGDDNSVTNKLWRCVKVTIELAKSVSNTVQSTLTERLVPSSPNQEVNENTSLDDLHQTNHLGPVEAMFSMPTVDIPEFVDLGRNGYTENFKDRTKHVALHRLSDNINRLALNAKFASQTGDVNLNSAYDLVNDFTGASKRYSFNNLGLVTNGNRGKSSTILTQEPMKNMAKRSGDAGLSNSLEDRVAEVSSAKEPSYSTREGTSNNKEVRYDNEAKFFTMLEKEEPFLHQKISDKIKYFDPAFHSISPEGFNARLTFLQQCTRQGPTIGNSDNYTADNTANNLSFGRPPVCILRIGDFYYTKIIIEGLTINYEPLMWDLNKEGIGVMPMIADINLRFKFIGGSSLAGHITRLQNALSFNYYANTEVYDNRSEMAEYDENGNIAKFKPNPTT